MKLISSPTQQAEALGLALARLFLQYQGALSNQIVLPLDAHIELFKKAKQQAELGHSISQQRTDLALFDLNATTRTIVCNLVEVKCYTEVGSIGNFNRLKEQIAEQIHQSRNVLRLHFEVKDRPDLLLKNRDAILLEFYFNLSRKSKVFLFIPHGLVILILGSLVIIQSLSISFGLTCRTDFISPSRNKSIAIEDTCFLGCTHTVISYYWILEKNVGQIEFDMEEKEYALWVIIFK